MQDKIVFNEKFEFNDNVTNVFSDMLTRSIPQYNVMRSLSTIIGNNFIKKNTSIIDIGASLGGAVDPFIERFQDENKYILMENSKPMLDMLRVKYAEKIDKGVVVVKEIDLKNEIKFDRSSLIMSILTIQFIPAQHRVSIFKNIFEALNNGGALILVEKMVGSSTKIDKICVDTYHDMKRENGYSEEQIESKRKALDGVMLPLPYDWNISFLKTAGFTEIDCFWRWMNFAGIVAIK